MAVRPSSSLAHLRIAATQLTPPTHATTTTTRRPLCDRADRREFRAVQHHPRGPRARDEPTPEGQDGLDLHLRGLRGILVRRARSVRSTFII